MKRILAGLLALAMMASTAVFASAEGENAITGISDSFYLVDDDGYVDLTRAADNVPYGRNRLFPAEREQQTCRGLQEGGKDQGQRQVGGKWHLRQGCVDSPQARFRRQRKISFGRRRQPADLFSRHRDRAEERHQGSGSLRRVTLKQTTGDKEYRFGEIAFDVAIELGYVSASKSEGEGIIPIKPASFSKRDGFEEESDYTFEFAAESNASFVVNTNGQGTIVLGMDIDFDDDIGDEYPTADLYFYNGNYAQFNRTGTLYLPGPSGDEGDYYVYAIDSKGRLSRVDAEWDEYEECYAIRTNILGRYVLSDEKLSTKSSSSAARPLPRRPALRAAPESWWLFLRPPLPPRPLPAPPSPFRRAPRHAPPPPHRPLPPRRPPPLSRKAALNLRKKAPSRNPSRRNRNLNRRKLLTSIPNRTIPTLLRRAASVPLSGC